MTPKDNDEYPQAEASRRRDAVLRNMLAKPPEAHQPLKAKKRRRTRSGASPKTTKPT